MKQRSMLFKKKFFLALALPLAAILLLSANYSYGADDPKVSYEKGIEYASEGKFAEAKQEFKKIPEDSTRYFQMAEKDLTLVEKVITDKKREDEAKHFFKGHLSSSQKKYQEAVASYTKAIELAPEFIDAYMSRGSIHFFSLNDKEKGCEDWKRACAYGECIAYNIANDRKLCK